VAMGPANCKVENDTGSMQHIYVFNYADGLRTIPRSEHKIAPGHCIQVKALAHGSGLIIATGKGANGSHMSCSNGSHNYVSALLKKGGNTWYKPCQIITMVGVAAAGAASGGLGAGAALSIAPACAAAAGTTTAGTIITSSAVAGATVGAGVSKKVVDTD